MNLRSTSQSCKIISKATIMRFAMFVALCAFASFFVAHAAVTTAPKCKFVFVLFFYLIYTCTHNYASFCQILIYVFNLNSVFLGGGGVVCCFPFFYSYWGEGMFDVVGVLFLSFFCPCVDFVSFCVCGFFNFFLIFKNDNKFL